uniref:DUF19 domain-containing protein n=1 Tax=Biomphalaria glabrata TaxID=6526 RepID=A0A2C9LCR9_BIOGL
MLLRVLIVIGSVVSLLTNHVMSNTTQQELHAIFSTYTPACQQILNTQTTIEATTYCDTRFQLWYEELVHIGFCTEEEYANLTHTVCDLNVTVRPSSEATTNFYSALNFNVSSACQRKVISCVLSSIILIILKQQEQYCSFVAVDPLDQISESCLTTPATTENFVCSLADFYILKKAACSINKTDVDQTFSRALLRTSTECRLKIANCSDLYTETYSFAALGKYCAFLTSGETLSTLETCFREENACTREEFDLLINSACPKVQQMDYFPYTSNIQPAAIRAALQQTSRTNEKILCR